MWWMSEEQLQPLDHKCRSWLLNPPTEFCDGLYFNKGLNCTEKVKNSESVFILKIHELPSTLILHLNVPKILTSVSATDIEVFWKSLICEPFQKSKMNGWIFVWPD